MVSVRASRRHANGRGWLSVRNWLNEKQWYEWSPDLVIPEAIGVASGIISSPSSPIFFDI